MYLAMLSLFVFIGKASLQCSDLQLENCKDLTKNYNLDISSLDDLSFKLMTSSNYEFDLICSNARIILSCVVDLANCDESLSSVENFIGGVKAVLYLCHDDRQGYYALKQCVAADPTWFNLCTSSPHSDCKSYNVLYTCLVDSAHAKCGNYSTIQRYFVWAYGSYIKYTFGCDLAFSNECDNSKLNQCNELAKNNLLDVAHLNELSFKLISCTTTEFNRLCSAASSIIDCIRTVAKCDETSYDVASIAGGVKAVQYLCNYDRAGYNTFVQCVARDSLWFTLCTNSKLTDCRSFNALYSCLVNSAERYCGSSATIKKYLELSYGTFAENAWSCRLDALVNYRCSSLILNQCIDLAKSQSMDEDSLSELGFKLIGSSPYEFSTLCRAAEDIINCVRIQANCNDELPTQAPLFSGVRAVQYLCNNDIEGYNRLQKCVQLDPSWFFTCTKDKLTDCRSYNVLYSCLVNSARRYCGNATSIRNYLYLSYRPFVKYYFGCDLRLLNKGSEMNVQPIILFFVAAYFFNN